MSSLYTTWLLAFFVTCLLELVVYQSAWFLCAGERRRLRGLKDCLMVNACTHPFIYLVLPMLVSDDALTYVLAAETVAVLGEALLLWKLRYRFAWSLSIAANLTSWWVGSWLIY